MAAAAPAIRVLDDAELAQYFALEWQLMGDQRHHQELARLCERYGDSSPIVRRMCQEMKPGKR